MRDVNAQLTDANEQIMAREEIFGSAMQRCGREIRVTPLTLRLRRSCILAPQ
jgi:hypothetical protein